MSTGVFAVSRGLFDHPMFAAEPFTEREAWIWLIKEAAWKDRKVRVGSRLVSLSRGQCVFSTRFMAGKWKWSEARVRRYLFRLKNDAMIDAVADAHATQITICNYDEYQRVSLPCDAPADAPSDAIVTHSRRKEEDREYIEEDISSLRSDMSADEPAPSPTPKAKPKRRIQIDASGYQPEIATALEIGLSQAEATAQVPKFFDYHRAKGSLMIDWAAAWRTWCRNAVEWRRGAATSKPSGPSADPPEWTSMRASDPSDWPPSLPPFSIVAKAYTAGNWASAWGPEPDYGGCRLPIDLQRRLAVERFGEDVARRRSPRLFAVAA